MKMLCDRVKELESHKEEFKAELGASATVHERLRILEKEIFEDADAYEDAITRHKESEIPVKEKPVESSKSEQWKMQMLKKMRAKERPAEVDVQHLDPLELNCLQVALDHLLEYLNDLPHEEDENGVRDMENEDKIEAQIYCTKNIIGFLADCKQLTVVKERR